MLQFDGAGRRPWPLWLPLVLGLVAAVTLAVQLARPIVASDIWWHMVLGRLFLETGSLIPDHSIFTWSPATSYHVYNSWLADVILVLIYERTGVGGLILLRYSIFLLFFLLAWSYAVRRGVEGNPLAWVVIIIGFTLTWASYLIKPELFTIGFMVLTVWLYFHIRSVGERAWYLVYLFPLMLVVWVNTHGAFFIVSLFFAAAGVGELLNARFCPSQAMPRILRKHFFIALALCFLALLVNPYGYELPYSIVRGMLSMEGPNRKVVAYKPTYVFNDPPLYLLDYMVVAMLLFVFLLWQKLKNRETDWVVILAFVAYCAIYTQLVRVTFFLGPVFVFAGLDLLGKKEGSWAWPSLRSARVGLAVLSISVVGLVGFRVADFHWCALSNAGDALQQRFGVSEVFPVAETEFIKSNLPGKNVGNIYREGGYLLYHLWPEKKVFIDPRYFPFVDWIDDYFLFTDGHEIERFTETYVADYWLINYGFREPFSWFGRSDDWEVALFGPVGALFVPAGTWNRETIIHPQTRFMDRTMSIATAFVAAVETNELEFGRHLYETAQRNLRGSCEDPSIVIDEMADTLAGIEAFNEGNYEESARLLGNKRKTILTHARAAQALTILVERSWKEGDFAAARDWSKQIFDVLPATTMIDLYNFALVDWHYRRYVAPGEEVPDDGLHWRAMVDFILEHESSLPDAKGVSIAKTARALKEGDYEGDGELLPRVTNDTEDEGR